MVLIRTDQDTITLVTDLMPLFKEHLRILHDDEDTIIEMYLSSAIDAIGTYAGTEIFLTSYEVYYPEQVDCSGQSTLLGWYCGRWNISNMIIKDENGIDVTSEYKIDYLHGMVYPHPNGKEIEFDTGFATKDDILPRLNNIIFRLGAEFFENRESTRVGEPKLLPDWVSYALASVWTPRT